MTEHAEPTTRHVVLHTPGPGWDADSPPFDQPGVSEHVAYLEDLARRKKIEMSGPFLKDGVGGMILLATNVSAEEAEQIGTNDPGVKSGLIRYEVRPWLITIRGAE